MLVLCAALVLSAFTACQPSDTTEITTDTTPIDTTEGGNPTLTIPEGETVEKNNYTAVLNDEKWVSTSVDSSQFDEYGAGADVYAQVNAKYQSYKRTFVIVENGEETELKTSEVFKALKAMGTVGASITVNEEAKTLTAKIHAVETKAMSSWKAVTAQAGTYIRFAFTASLPMDYCITVTPKAGDSASKAVYTQDNIKVTGENGTYTGMGQATVPFDFDKTYYINICVDAAGYPVLDSFPIHVIKGKYNVPYQLVFQGDWTYIEDESYFEKFIDLFYNVYPRLNARWGGTGKEPKTVTLLARLDYDGVAYASGSTVGYSVNYLNAAPDRIGSLSHELTHSVQKYHYLYGKPHWFTENMANYGRHRYWSYGYCNDFIEEKDPKDSKDWGYSEYGNSQLFFSWMDWTYPTLDKNSDGKISPDERGLLDLLVYGSKEWTGADLDDDPYKEGSVFNNWVKEKTGFATMDKLRLEFVRQLEAGEWTFKGFRDYPDNFLTENIPGCPNPTYPMHETLQPTGKTNPILANAITSGDNLCKTARIHKLTTMGSSKYLGENMLDGDLETRYQASRNNSLYKLNGVQNEITIDLGAVKTFDTYTLIGVGDSTQKSFDLKRWEILVSSDGATFTAVDYQKDNTATAVSVTFEEQSARYVMIRMFESDQTGAGALRIAEFMLFDTK